MICLRSLLLALSKSTSHCPHSETFLPQAVTSWTAAGGTHAMLSALIASVVVGAGAMSLTKAAMDR